MNIKELFKLKYILLILGFIIILVSYFLPLTTSCEVTNGPEEIILTNQFGYETFTYYLSTIFIGSIILSSYIGTGSYILSVFFTLFGGVITIFFNWIGEAGMGKPCGYSPTHFQNLLYVAHLLIIIACFMNLSNKKGKKISNELIDDIEKPL